MRVEHAKAVFAGAATIILLFSASANADTERQKRDCKADYNHY
jgi:hypothetical protein